MGMCKRVRTMHSSQPKMGLLLTSGSVLFELLMTYARGLLKFFSLCVKGYTFVVTNLLKPLRSDKVLWFVTPFILHSLSLVY